MQKLIKTNIENDFKHGPVVSSRTVAEELGKRQDVVLRDIDNILKSHSTDLSSEIISHEYTNSRGRKYREYLLTKDGFTLYMFNIQGHNDFKMAYINKFNEMEEQIKQTAITSSDSYMIEDPVQRAKRWIEEQQEKLMLEQEIGELKPKADYVDEILRSTGTMTVTQIAADYGLSANKLNKILNEARLQRKVGNQWILYKEHMNKGLTKSNTISIVRSDGRQDTKLQTKWTQKGRLKIHEILTEKGYEAQLSSEIA
ncbi:phage antirepressor KilAC domain-containing protein [Mammaliicoccus sciuri]|uniref:phage antirepressor KilAC domain-containing protein n=1 Tax=Mammaliicoccus sciuri TaxID=1296 RepID=UPI00378AE0B8